MRFEKWQALANDYVIVEASQFSGEPSKTASPSGEPSKTASPSGEPSKTASPSGEQSKTGSPGDRPMTPELVRALCDRHTGIGADGVLVLAPPDEPGFVARLRIFNPDGSEAELSGNGARQAILYLRRAGWTDARQFSIQTAAGEIRPTILSDTTCRVDMGRASLRREGEVHGFRFQHLVIGNPQTAIHVADPATLEALDLAALGPPIETDPQFPQRTNVSWFTALDGATIRARIFERGVGETASSGTGACGAAIAHVMRGGDSPVTVKLDGGELEVDVGEDLHVDLTGWALPVFSGEIDPAFPQRPP